jgi:hypothetical protein
MRGVNAKIAEMISRQTQIVRRGQIVRRAQPGPVAHNLTERLKMGDLCALVDPSSGCPGSRVIYELPNHLSDASHIARLSSYLAVCFRAGGAAAQGGA